MKNMIKKIWIPFCKRAIQKIAPKKLFLAILGIFVFMIFFKFFTLLEFPDSSVVLEKGELVNLAPKAGLTQTFIANRDNLMKIQFLVRTPGPKPADTVSIEIADESCSKTIRKGVLDIPFLNSDNLYEFTFSKIPDSNGKKYCIISTFKSKNSTSKGIRFFSTTANDSGLTLKNSATGEVLDGKTLSIRGVYVNDHYWQDLRELDQRISQYKPWFLKQYFIGAIIILFVFLSIATAVILISL